MTSEEIARKLCKHSYLNLCEQWEQEAGEGYSFEEYWKKNGTFFIRQAEVYLEVKQSLEGR